MLGKADSLLLARGPVWSPFATRATCEAGRATGERRYGHPSSLGGAWPGRHARAHYMLKPVDFAQFTESVRSLGLYWLVYNQSPHRD